MGGGRCGRACAGRRRRSSPLSFAPQIEPEGGDKEKVPLANARRQRAAGRRALADARGARERKQLPAHEHLHAQHHDRQGDVAGRDDGREEGDEDERRRGAHRERARAGRLRRRRGRAGFAFGFGLGLGPGARGRGGRAAGRGVLREGGGRGARWARAPPALPFCRRTTHAFLTSSTTAAAASRDDERRRVGDGAMAARAGGARGTARRWAGWTRARVAPRRERRAGGRRGRVRARPRRATGHSPPGPRPAPMPPADGRPSTLHAVLAAFGPLAAADGPLGTAAFAQACTSVLPLFDCLGGRGSGGGVVGVGQRRPG